MGLERVTLVGAVIAACGGQVSNRYNGAQIGQPCTPVLESDPTFLGFDANEVSVELPSPDADPGQLVCLVDHFQGVTTSAYAQTTSSGTVDAQCTDRRAADVVTWSCRCANAVGGTNDGHEYCSCASGTSCVQLVDPVGTDDTAGAYCIKTGTEWGPSSCEQTCDPVAAPCP